MEITIKNIDDTHYACVRHTGPYNQIGSAFERLASLNSVHSFAKPGGAWVAIYRDNPDTVPQDQLRSDAGVVVEPRVHLPEGVTLEVIPAGKYATVVNKGAYSGLGEAWGTFCGKLIPEAGLKSRDGICFEAYIHDGEGVPESEQLTELYEPVA